MVNILPEMLAFANTVITFHSLKKEVFKWKHFINQQQKYGTLEVTIPVMHLLSKNFAYDEISLDL